VQNLEEMARAQITEKIDADRVDVVPGRRACACAVEHGPPGLVGPVADASGGVIRGATVVASQASGKTLTLVTYDDGMVAVSQVRITSSGVQYISHTRSGPMTGSLSITSLGKFRRVQVGANKPDTVYTINVNETNLSHIEIKRHNITTGQLTFSLFFPFIVPLVILFLSGSWFWIQGWIFGIWFVALCLSATLYLYFRDPALLKERFQPLKTTNQKREQAYLIYVTLLVFLAWLVIMPLDAKRYGWTTNFPIGLEAIGAVALVLSFFFIFRSSADYPLGRRESS
jgi:hypothetical protein